MLLASTTLFFRVHTRVLLTLFVALSIAILGLTGSALHPAPVLAKLAEKPAAQGALPLEPADAGLPRMVIRLFFLLPHLVPYDN